MNTLIALGAGAGFIYSALATLVPVIFFSAGLHPDVYFEAVNAIIALILLGRLLEGRARGQMSEAIRALISLRPKTTPWGTRRRGPGHPDWKRWKSATGWMMPSPAEHVPSTARWSAGESSVKSGDARRRADAGHEARGRRALDRVAGCHGSIAFEAKAVARGSGLAGVAHLVEEPGRRAPVSTGPMRVASVFVPV